MPEPILGTDPQHYGTWLDGSQGWHNTYRVIDVAESYGFDFSAEDRTYLDAYREGLDEEIDGVHPADVIGGQCGLADAATEFLNGLCVEGAHFEWDCGELCLVHETDPDEPHEGHFSALGGTWYCDTCNSPYCDLA